MTSDIWHNIHVKENVDFDSVQHTTYYDEKSNVKSARNLHEHMLLFQSGLIQRVSNFDAL